jgi:hypothetical protein
VAGPPCADDDDTRRKRRSAVEGSGLLNVSAVRSVHAAGTNGPDTGDFAVDLARRRRWSTIGFGAAASLMALLGVLHPNRWTLLGAVLLTTLFIGRRSLGRVVRFVAFVVVPYQLIWTGFVTARGFGDQVGWVDQVRLWPRRLEVRLFGGEMPTTLLQRHLFNPDHPRPYDYFFTGLHVSFFAVPFLFAMPLCWGNPRRGRRFLLALVLLLGMGLSGFFLVPANPPWMNAQSGDPNPLPAYRINAYVAQHLGVDAFAPDGTLKVEENSLAAIPSIHMGVSFLLLLSALGGRRRWRVAMGLYATLMAFSLVYLGEHMVVDELLGIALAVIAWRLSAAVSMGMERRLAALPTGASARWISGAIAGGRTAVRARFSAGDGSAPAGNEPVL